MGREAKGLSLCIILMEGRIDTAVRPFVGAIKERQFCIPMPEEAQHRHHAVNGVANGFGHDLSAGDERVAE